MGQNVTGPAGDLVPAVSIAEISQAVISEVALPVVSVSLTVSQALSGAGFSQSSNKKGTIFTAADAILKRSIDVFVATSLLITTAPLFMILSVLVSLDGGGVFFRHRRIGRNLQPFGCLKFRTMIPNAEKTLAEYLELNSDAALEWARDHKLVFDIRVTPAGRILRKTSLDELPQLWNVLRGDMSLVGPRPITAKESERYGSSLREYAKLRPGLTGLWQVSGRNEISYEGRVALDTHYARHRNVWTDLAILLVDTPRALFSRRGAR